MSSDAKPDRVRVILLACLMLISGTPAFAWAGVILFSHPETTVLQGRVIGVSDGDTLTVLDEARISRRIRLLGIDAPEKGQPWGKVAKQVLLDRVINRSVMVLVQSRDRYGRTVGEVLLGGEDVNLEMIRDGLAWHDPRYAKNQFPGDAARCAHAESEARRTRLGLWAGQNPIPPWEWRHRRVVSPKP